MDTIFLIEIGIVASIILVQIRVFFRNISAIEHLSNIFPNSSQLVPSKPEDESEAEENWVKLIELNPKFSETFRQVIETTNAYLLNSQGGSELDILKDLAGQKVAAQERAIESNISLPLYIGLLCTFIGVIIGLVKIAMVGLSDPAIQSFIGGILIGMVGSATGLALTVSSNYRLKEAKKRRDHNQYDYHIFLRTHILPPRDTHMPTATLRKNLAAFHEGFSRYQDHMNESLGDTLAMVNELLDVCKSVRVLEQEISGIGNFMEANTGMIEMQMNYLDTYTQQAEELSQRFHRHVGNMNGYLSPEPETILNGHNGHNGSNGFHFQETHAAYVKMDHYLGSPPYQDTLELAEAMNHDMKSLRGDMETLQLKQYEIYTQLIGYLQHDQRSDLETGRQISLLHGRIGQLIAIQEDSFLHSRAFRTMIYTIVGSIGLMAMGGAIYWIKLLLGS